MSDIISEAFSLPSKGVGCDETVSLACGGTIAAMRLTKPVKLGLILVGIALLGWLAYQVPYIQQRLAWRVDFAAAYLNGVIHPVGGFPTSLPPPQIITTNQAESTPTLAPTLTDTPGPSPTPPPTPTPIPNAVSLPAPAWERQDINNCGPAALAMYLRFYGWEGDQFVIADLLKPQREDRNVNVEELAYFVRTRAGWLNVEYRLGGNIEMLKRLLAAGVPVMIEESFYFEKPYWPNDDLWAAHYNLLTGYDDLSQTFTSQDSFYGSDQQVAYQKLKTYWQVFNYLYILVYPPEKQAAVQAILGKDWEANANRQNALELAQAETQSDPDNAYAWFNLGSNLVYFERYPEAALAYDKAREIGLPQRMLRYQFGPFFAYFHTGRISDLMAITEYALQRTPTSEEALLWRGWGYFRQGKAQEAIADFQAALEQNPNYQDAQYALDFVLNSQ